MKVGELSARTGASIRSLRYYESVGLLTAERTPSGQRVFIDEDVDRVEIIRRLLAVGLGTRAIADVLPCMAAPSSQTSRLTERLVTERDRLSAEITERTLMRDALNGIIRSAPPLDD